MLFKVEKWQCSFARQNDITVRQPRGIYLGPEL